MMYSSENYLLTWPFLFALNALAKPKSANFSTPFFVISTFAAFISLCRIWKKKEKICNNDYFVTETENTADMSHYLIYFTYTEFVHKDIANCYQNIKSLTTDQETICIIWWVFLLYPRESCLSAGNYSAYFFCILTYLTSQKKLPGNFAPSENISWHITELLVFKY